MGGDRGREGRGGGGVAGDPDPHPPGKLKIIIYFLEEKLAEPPFRSKSTPDPIGVVWIHACMSGRGIIFLF